MALHQDILANDAGAPVMPVSGDHTPEQVNKAEENALAERTVIQQQQASITEAEQNAPSPTQKNDETSLGMDLMAEALMPGAKTILSAVQLVGQRIADIDQTNQQAAPAPQKNASNGDSIFGAVLNTVQDVIHKDHDQQLSGSMGTSHHAVGAAMKKAPMDIEDFLARTEITRSSLQKPEPMGMIGDKNDVAVENADMNGTSVPNVSHERSLTSKKSADLENVMSSVHGARMAHQSRMGLGMDLGLGMSNGPVFRAGDIGKIEDDQKKDWWQQNMEDAG